MGAPNTKVEITRGPDGDLVRINGAPIPGAYLMFQDAIRVVIAIPAGEVTVNVEAGPQVRRYALGESE